MGAESSYLAWRQTEMAQPGAIAAREAAAAAHNAAMEQDVIDRQDWREMVGHYNHNAATEIAGVDNPPYEPDFRVVQVPEHQQSRRFRRAPAAPNTDPRQQPPENTLFEGWTVMNREIPMGDGKSATEVTFVDKNTGQLMVYIDTRAVERTGKGIRHANDPMNPRADGRVVRMPYGKDYAKRIGARHFDINGVHDYRDVSRRVPTDDATENTRLMNVKVMLKKFGINPNSVSNLP